jgi:hypothetical protein
MDIMNEFNVGDEVIDGLTDKKAKIIGISFSHGHADGNECQFAVMTIGYWLDNDYLGGGRHPWEISKL